MARRQLFLMMFFAALTITAFQNCSDVNFDKQAANLEKGEGIAGGDLEVEPEVMPPVDVEREPGSPEVGGPEIGREIDREIEPEIVPPMDEDREKKDPIADNDEDLVPKTPALPAPTDGRTIAANCQVLRETFISEKLTPASLSTISQRGKSEVGPLYVSSVKVLSTVGTSAVYLVGSDEKSLVQLADLRGASHVILCGINVQDASLVGNAKLDLIGSNVLGQSKAVGTAKIRLFKADGTQIK